MSIVFTYIKVKVGLIFRKKDIFEVVDRLVEIYSV